MDRLSQSWDPLIVSDSYLYSGRHQLTKITHAADSTYILNSYDNYGNRYAVRDENNFTTTISYDEYHRVLSVTVPVNAPQVSGSQVPSRSQSFDYTRRDNSDAVVGDAFSHTGRNWSVCWQPSGAAIQRIFSPDNWQTDEYDGMTVNGSSNPVVPRPGSGSMHTSQAHYANGQLQTSTDAEGFTTSYGYDSSERIASISDPMGHTTTPTYYGNQVHSQYGSDCSGLLKTFAGPGTDTTYAAMVTTQYTNYDQNSKLTLSVDPKGNSFNSIYDAVGDLGTQGDGAEQASCVYGYDTLGRKSTLKYPDQSVEKWTYDAAGNVKTYVDRAGTATCTYSYDGRNRCTGYQWSDGVTSNAAYSYDAGSRLKEASNANSDIQFAYDDSGALISESELTVQPTRMVTTYTHDVDGKIDSIRYPNGNLPCFTYDDQERCTSMYSGNTAFGTYTYSGDRLVERYLYNNLYTSCGFQANGRVNSLWHLNNNFNPVHNVRRSLYGYAPDGQVSWTDRETDTGNKMIPPSGSSLENGRGDVFNYNGDGSLADMARDVAVSSWPMGADGSNPADGDTRVPNGGGSYSSTDTFSYYNAYTYDGAGNRTQYARTNPVTGAGFTIPYSDNGKNENQYATIAYDTNGNTTNFSVGWTYGYDAENHLKTASGPSGQTLSFAYDVMGRLIEQVNSGIATYFFYAGAQRIEEHNASNQAIYLYFFEAPGSDHVLFRQDGTDGRLWYLSDLFGNTTHLATDAGTVVEQYLYDAYGTPTVFDGAGNLRSGGSQYDNRYLFQGNSAYEWIPQAGLCYCRDRFYLPQHGRFLQTDPVGQAGGLNIYAYCGNDPVNTADPDGCEDPDPPAVPVLNAGADGTDGRVIVTGNSIPNIGTLADQQIDSILNRAITNFQRDDSFQNHPELYPKNYNVKKGINIRLPGGVTMTARPANSWSAPWGLNDDSSLEIFNAQPLAPPDFEADTPAKKILAGFLPGTTLHSMIGFTKSMSEGVAVASTAALGGELLPVEEGFVATRGFWVGPFGEEAAKDLFLRTLVFGEETVPGWIAGSRAAASAAAGGGQIVPVFIDSAAVIGGAGNIFFGTELPILEAAGSYLQWGVYY